MQRGEVPVPPVQYSTDCPATPPEPNFWERRITRSGGLSLPGCRGSIRHFQSDIGVGRPWRMRRYASGMAAHPRRDVRAAVRELRGVPVINRAATGLALRL